MLLRGGETDTLVTFECSQKSLCERDYLGLFQLSLPSMSKGWMEGIPCMVSIIKPFLYHLPIREKSRVNAYYRYNHVVSGNGIFTVKILLGLSWTSCFLGILWVRIEERLGSFLLKDQVLEMKGVVKRWKCNALLPYIWRLWLIQYIRNKIASLHSNVRENFVCCYESIFMFL